MSTNDPGVPKPAEKRGLICPKCGCADLRVMYTRHRVGVVLRARDCRHCGRRIITRERAG
jgi:transcriptional regulator NrdR family protein